MTRTATAKLGAYAGLAALGLIGALVAGRPELVALAAPFALVAAIGLVLTEEPRVSALVRPARERVIEGAELPVTIELGAERASERLEVLLALPDGLATAGGDNPIAIRLPAGERRQLDLSIGCERWGGYLVGDLHLRASDRFGLVRYESRLDLRSPLKVYPRPERVRSLLRPLETQVFTGNQVARQKGEGIEFADLRPFLVGDRIRRINWRASARRGELWVNEYHAERNADVVLFVDSFAEARRGGATTLDLIVRAAAALAEGYLEQKDRVGFISFGGVLNWLLPATGIVQLYRIIDSLLDTEIVLNYAWKDIDVIPRRTLPPQALVVALTPLLDERANGALLDLRSRGFDLAIVEVSPVPFTAPGDEEYERLAYRLWQLKREALRARYLQAGVPVAVWEEGTPLVGPLEEVRAFRRYARRAPV
jgi:uncharacterized protein (DUF58 family)